MQRHRKYTISVLYYYCIQYTMQLCCNGETEIFLYIGAFFSCLDERLPETLLELRHMPSVRRFNSWWRKWPKIFNVILTFRKCKKNSPVLKQILKMLPSWRHTVRMLVEHVFYSLLFLPSNCANLMIHTHHTQNTNFFFVIKREFVSPGFSLLQYWLLHRENQASLEENTKCWSISHCVQTEETNLKNVFLQLDHVPSKHEPPSYMVAVVTILWLLMPIFSKQSPEWRNYLRHFLAHSYVKYSCTKSDAVQQCTWVKACCYITEGVKNAFMCNKPYDSLARDCYPRHFHTKTVRESWRGCILTQSLDPHSPN